MKSSILNYAEIHKGIVEDCKSGNRKAQYELYNLYSKAMYNICLRMLNNVEDAEDLLQNSFVDVFTKLDRFRYESSIGAWIKRIVVNNCINYLKKKRLNFVEMGDRQISAEECREEYPDLELSVEKINRAIKQLPDGYRVIFSLYAMEGYDHQEIAEIMNITASTSKSQYSRAKKKLLTIIQ